MHKIPEQVRRNVFFDYLAAKKTRENAARNKVSTGAVSEIVKGYLSLLKDKDPGAMSELALYCSQRGIELAKLARSISLHNALFRDGGDSAEQDLDEWLTLLISLSKESPEKVYQILVEILRVSERESMSPILTLERIKQIKQEESAEEGKLNNLKDQTAKANLSCDDALAAAGLTKPSSELFTTLAKKMNGWGLTTAEKIVRFVEEMEKLGADPKRAVAELASKDKLKQGMKELLDENSRLAKEQESKRAKDSLVSLLYDLPLTKEVWMKFSIKAHARAIERREDADTAAERILIDLLDYYDPVDGLKITILKLQNSIETRQKEIGALELAKTNMINTNRILQQDNEKEAKRKRELHDDIKLIEQYKTNLRNDVKEIDGRIKKVNAEKKILLEAEKQQYAAAGAAPAQPRVVDKSGVVFLGSGVTTLHSRYVSNSGFSSNNK